MGIPALAPGNPALARECGRPASQQPYQLPHGPFIVTTNHDHRKWALWGLRSKCIWTVQEVGDGWHTCNFKHAVSFSNSLVEVLVAELDGLRPEGCDRCEKVMW